MVGLDIEKKSLNMVQVSIIIIIVDLAAFAVGGWMLFCQ